MYNVNNGHAPGFSIAWSRQDKTVILGEISTNFPPIFRLWYPIRCFSDHMFTEFAYFPLFPSISAYFLPEMVPHPCYKLKHGTQLLFFRPHVYGFCLFSAYIPLIFRLFPPNLKAHIPPVLSCRGFLLLQNVMVRLVTERTSLKSALETLKDVPLSS